METADERIQFDDDGFMREPELWNEQVGAMIAKDEGIETVSEQQRRSFTPPVRAGRSRAEPMTLRTTAYSPGMMRWRPN